MSVLPAPCDEWDPNLEALGTPITGDEEPMEARVITNWSVRSNPFQAPEVRGLYLHGECEGKPIATSRVAEKVAPLTYRTKSGSLYRLEGEPEPGYVQYCAENNIDLDLADPIKLRKGQNLPALRSGTGAA